jgi:hypothetical protein
MKMKAGSLVALAGSAAVLATGGVALAADPTVVTEAPDATLLTDSYALLSGTINPNGNDSLYHFEWGRTAGYGHTTPVTPAGNGKAEVPVDISLDTLKPSTTYHYRLVVTPVSPGAFANLFGADQSFKTYPALGLAFRSVKAPVSKKGKAAVKVLAVGPPEDPAKGRLTLAAKLGGRTKTLGSAHYNVGIGHNGTLLVSLTKAGKAALAATGRLVVTATARTAGVKAPVVKKLTLEA